MFLVRLVYASRVSPTFKPSDIENIIEIAKRNNEKSLVTGLLCFNSRIFLQCLEGNRASVNKTYHKILKDDRHEDVVLLDYSDTTQREFPEWQMGYVPEKHLTRNLNMKYSGTPSFDPYEMHGKSCVKMLLELREHIPLI